MCCSAWSAQFSKTITGTWEVMLDGKINHVLWYQNRVGRGVSGVQIFEILVRQAMAGAPDELSQGPRQVNQITLAEVKLEAEWRKNGNRPRSLGEIRTMQEPAEGNALIIPLAGTWESIKILNTADTSHLLEDVSYAVESPIPHDLTGAMPAAPAVAYGAIGGVVFIQFDIYDILLAERPCDLPVLLPQIQEAKRPAINAAVFERLEQWYRCPIAVCCFQSNQQAESKPIAFAFEPLNPEEIVVYTLDGHDGQPPDPNALVPLDHEIFVGSYLTPAAHASEIQYTDPIPDHLRPYLLPHAMGVPLHYWGQMKNGDINFETQRVREGYFEGKRQLPRYAEDRQIAQRIIRQSQYRNGNESLYTPFKSAAR